MRLHGRAEGFYLWPDGGRVSDEIARALLEREDIQPFDPDLPGFGSSQSWKRSNWRSCGALKDTCASEGLIPEAREFEIDV